MNIKKHIFFTSDETDIEVIADYIENPIATLVIWPCMGGSVLMYRCPVEQFNKAGISVIRFNPRGHGNSSGQFVPEAAIADLNEFIGVNKRDDSPIYIVGHSAGANAVLQYGTAFGDVDRFILISPVLDSIESLRYMYQQKTIMEFNVLISALTSDKDLIHHVLADSMWMAPEIWESKNYRERLDAVSFEFKVGIFLERLFIQGYNTFPDLVLHGDKSTILLPKKDNWYPKETVMRLSAENSIPVVTMSEANDHFFTGAWKTVWDWVREDMDLCYR